MKGTIASLIIFASVFVLGVAPNLQAEENRECTNATLEGRYAAIQHGTFFDDRGLSAGVGVMTFDGKGEWSNTVTYVNGRGVNRYATASGTYMVNSDCTGSGGPDLEFDLVIIDGGKEVHIVIASPDRVVTWTLKKQFPGHHDDEEN